MRTPEEVLIVVYRPGPEFLVLLRSPEKHGYWNPVAGGIEEGESPATAARREFEEETGLGSDALAALPLELGYQRPPESGGFWVKLYPFAVEVATDWEPVLNEEHVDYRWCDAAEALELLAYPEPRTALRHVVERLGVAT